MDTEVVAWSFIVLLFIPPLKAAATGYGILLNTIVWKTGPKVKSHRKKNSNSPVSCDNPKLSIRSFT